MENKNKSYNAKLLDPRWQKKRLEIFERDHWTCQCCEATDMPLHIHHFYYSPGMQPWDYPIDALVTLCENCHGYETKDWDFDGGRLFKEMKNCRLFYVGISVFFRTFFEETKNYATAGECNNLLSLFTWMLETPQRIADEQEFRQIDANHIEKQ